MAKTMIHKGRLSIDLPLEEHKKIKIYATFHSQTIRDYVLESIRERLRHEAEERDLSTLTLSLEKDPVLRALWDNEKDAAYDKL